MTQPYSTADEGGKRIVELTREIAGAQGLATLMRQIWQDADEEYRKKLAGEFILAICSHTYLIREAVEPIARELLAKDEDLKAQIQSAVEDALPRVVAEVVKNVEGQIKQAAHDAVPDALRRVIERRRY